MNSRDRIELWSRIVAIWFLGLAIMWGLSQGCQAAEIPRWSGIVVHHSASHDVSVLVIDRWHREKGWDGIGYHFLIRRNGIIEVGRPLTKHGAHARTGKPYSRNRTHIGICLVGYDNFTPDQITSLKKLTKTLTALFPTIRTVERHHEQCPGPGLKLEKIWEQIKREVENGKATYAAR